MDFFESQAAARRRTILLVFYYFLSVLVLIPLVYFVVLSVAVPVRAVQNFFGEWYNFEGAYQPLANPGWWAPELFLWVAIATVGVMLAGTLVRLRQVSRGGYVVAELLDGERVDPDADAPELRRLLNVVEEMAIASGLPVPEVYVLPVERGINAFAAGFTPDDAVIGVTRGCLDLLGRDELQGVIAHEFSHILYGDTRLKTILIGLLHGLVYLGILSNRACLEAVKGEPVMVAGAFTAFVLLGFITIPLLLILQVGLGLAGAIKRLVSHQREYLADAAAVQFTRNPSGLAGALKKVGGYTCRSCVLSAAAGEASHFFFADARRDSLLRFVSLSSHPGLTQRIQRLDPGFDGSFEDVVGDAPAVRTPDEAEAALAGDEQAGYTVDPESVLESIGAPGAEHMVFAAALLAGIPARLSGQARGADGARGVIYALLLNREPDARRVQLQRLRSAAGPALLAETQKALLMLGGLKADRRLPLATMAIRSLKTMSPDAYREFCEHVAALMTADRRIDLFEFALQRMIMHRLEPAFEKTALNPRPRPRRLGALLPGCRDLLSCLAQWGTYDHLAREDAYRKGFARLTDEDGAQPPPLLAADECSVEKAGNALDRLTEAALPLRKKILAACIACIAADGRTTIQESELLQAVADALGCPLPPILPSAR